MHLSPFYHVLLSGWLQEALLGMAPPAGSEVAAAIRRAVPAGHTFKGVPQHHRSLAAPVMLDSLLALPLVREMLLLPWVLAQQRQQEEQQWQGAGVVGHAVVPVVYALRLKASLYPEDVASVWLMFVAKYSNSF